MIKRMSVYLIAQVRGKEPMQVRVGQYLSSKEYDILRPTLYGSKHAAKRFVTKYKRVIKRYKDRPIVILRCINQDKPVACVVSEVIK